MFYVDQSAHPLVCLVCLETMVVKIFVFMENEVGSQGIIQTKMEAVTQFWVPNLGLS